MRYENKSLSASVLIPTRAVCQRYNVCPRTINRWENQPGLDFPEPVVINGRKYHWLQKLENWDRQRVRLNTRVEASAKEGA